MKNKLVRWLHYVVYEECDDPRVPGKLRVKGILHNAVLIQLLAACSIVVGLPLSALIFFVLFSVPYAFLAYVVVVAALSLFLYFGRRHEKMKERD